MIVVNTETVPGCRIVELKGMVQGNTVRAKHAGRDIAAGLKNLIGGELKGYTELLTESRREAVSRMKELGAASVRLGAQQYATGLYEKCGFVPCGPVYLDEGNPHVPMCLRLPHSGK